MQKVVRWFLYPDDNPDSYRNLILLFGPLKMFLEICMQTHTLLFALSRQISKQKYAKTINLLCAGNKVFVKYQAQGG